jgi:DNA-binding MarR family transcriptional regulator
MLHDQESIGHLLGTARRRIKLAVLSRVRRFRLTPLQFWVLIGLYEHSGTPLGELAQRERIDAPTASRVVTALKRRGLVRLATDAADRRRTRIDLGPQGQAMMPRLRPIAAALRDAMREGMTAAEEESLRASLRKVIGNLARYEQAAPPSGGRSANGKLPAMRSRVRMAHPGARVS